MILDNSRLLAGKADIVVRSDLLFQDRTHGCSLMHGEVDLDLRFHHMLRVLVPERGAPHSLDRRHSRFVRFERSAVRCDFRVVVGQGTPTKLFRCLVHIAETFALLDIPERDVLHETVDVGGGNVRVLVTLH